jgi:hypothetical protein
MSSASGSTISKNLICPLTIFSIVAGSLYPYRAGLFWLWPPRKSLICVLFSWISCDGRVGRGTRLTLAEAGTFRSLSRASRLTCEQGICLAGIRSSKRIPYTIPTYAHNTKKSIYPGDPSRDMIVERCASLSSTPLLHDPVCRCRTHSRAAFLSAEALDA